MNFTIEVRYRTGDSFNTFNECECIGATFDTIDLARKALTAIKEHHHYIREVDGYSFSKDYPTPEDKEAFYKKLSSHDWFLEPDDEFGDEDNMCANNLIHSYTWQHHLMVEVKPDVFQRISAFWVGYFEHIDSAEVVVNKSSTDTSLRIEF